MLYNCSLIGVHRVDDSSSFFFGLDTDTRKNINVCDNNRTTGRKACWFKEVHNMQSPCSNSNQITLLSIGHLSSHNGLRSHELAT